ncbi:MAG: J domain-containing protein [Oscillospiraceae bacterium]|nr:J domain-containing protein [Oscillospiraceae bacterium]
MDPYRILGVMPTASDDEIRSVYRSLLQRYAGNDEKIAEINSAYDQIMNMRRGSFEQSGASGFAEVRHLLQNGNYNDADGMLNAMQERTAEWYFLKGSVCYAKGWLNDAYSHFEQACRMEPYNQEYSSAFNHMKQSQSGYMRGNPNEPNLGGNAAGTRVCSVCDICNGLICADCCCECMGGDCIPCC